RRRRFMRYLTLGHLAYDGQPADDVEVTREAAGKLLNSLSWHPQVTLPEPIDMEATILRFDLRAYKWAPGVWEKFVRAYPYPFQDAARSRPAPECTGTEVAALRADWLGARVSRAPFYHDLLELAVTDRALERSLQVDVPGDLQDDNVLRAGFNDSGV